MPFDLGSVLSNGVERVLSKSGGVALGVHTLVHFLVVTALFGGAFVFVVLEQQPILQLLVGCVMIVFFFSGWAGLALAYVGTTRWLVRPEDSLQTTPWSAFTRRAGLAVVSVMTLNFVLWVAFMFGLALFVLPGIIVATVSIFSLIVVAVEDVDPMTAIKRSWTLTEDHLIELFIIGFIFHFAFSVAGHLFGLLIFIPLIGWLILAAFYGVQTVLSIGILVEAYRQISDETAAT